jgi:endonuclease YncB( thermonuclease family)
MDDSTARVRLPTRPGPRRTCARRGCTATVKKPTAKYCSVRCCSIDPERLEKLRVQARRAGGRPILPLARQLTLSFAPGAHASHNPEELLNVLCQGREDVPGGLARLIV